jgi:hypothetical protein
MGGARRPVHRHADDDLDETIVNVALPVMQEELGPSRGSVSWVINAYLIAHRGLLVFANATDITACNHK